MPITEPQIGYDPIQLNGSVRSVNINSIYDDMENANDGNGLWIQSGSVTLNNGIVANHPGVFVLQSQAAGGGSQITGAGNTFPPPNAFYKQFWLVQFPVLSTVAETYVARIGFLVNVAPASPSDGVYFVYSSNNGLDWICRTENSNVVTEVHSGITVNAGQWYQLMVTGNGIDQPASFYIDGVLITTINTNLPSTATALNHAAMIAKTVGATSLNMFLDYFAFQYAFSPAR